MLRNDVFASLVLAFAVACGTSSSRRAPAVAQNTHAAAKTFTTTTREPLTPLDHELVKAGHVLDPALDCVARAYAAAIHTPAVVVYRHELPLRCGSPLYVLRADVVTDDAAVMAAVRQQLVEQPSSVPLAIGLADVGGKRAVVVARKGIELDPVSRAKANVISGRLLLRVDAATAYLSSAGGVRAVPMKLDGDRFTVPLEAPGDLLVELTINVGGQTGPIGRLELGAGSALFRGKGSAVERANAARRAVGAPPLVAVENGSRSCDPIAPRVANIDVTDAAKCVQLPRLALSDLGDELACRAELQYFALHPDAVVFETATIDDGLLVRLLRRFENLAPEAGRARVLAMLRKRWPTLAVRTTPEGELSSIMNAWSKETDPLTTAAAHKPAVDRVAGEWTHTRTFYTGLTAARDLATALDLLKPDVTPTAADAALVQVRTADGGLRHLVAVILEI